MMANGVVRIEARGARICWGSGRLHWWIPTTMSAPASTSRGSSISQHLCAIKGILQDATSDPKYVRSGQDKLCGMANVRISSVANTTLYRAEVGPTNKINLWAVTYAVPP